jgi:predicted nucleotide-binding protein
MERQSKTRLANN